ncbi:hypothetical protein OO012_07785 [Rhodobacteraceae bacterium KMM 6894]|nr:hypothetical protein [Rhodobacteraceae bacterium KMM 6894]
MLYDIPTYQISLGLLAAMLLCMYGAYRMGHARQTRETDESRNQTTAVQGSLLGLLALLLGFTFSLGLSRHDSRATAVVEEANAIGTAWLRADFLPEDARKQAKTDMKRYLRLRVEAGEVSADQIQRRDRLVANAQSAFDDLWAAAALHAQAPGGPAAVAYAASLNDMIDALGSRDAAIERHVPEIVIMMLFATFLLSGAMLGYASGIAGAMPAAPVYLMMALIVILVFMIIDLDRPRRGLIEVDQSPMVDLLESIRAR